MSHDLTEQSIASFECGVRRVRLLPTSVDALSPGLLIVLDGEIYADRLPTREAIEEGQRSGRLRPFWTVFVDQGDQPTRWRDTMCSEPFADFLADELLPWFRENVAPVENGDVAIGGLSLSGLQAAFTAVRHPNAFPTVFCQSPSFWWQDARLASICDDLPPDSLNGLRMRVICGLDETHENVDHGSGLIQTMSQLAGCRVVCDALASHGCAVEYAEIPGGHDLATWTRDLPNGLEFTFGNEPRST